MNVHGQALARVQQLHQHTGVAGITVVATNPGQRIVADRITQQRAVFESGWSEVGLTEAARRGAHPLLGRALTDRRQTAPRRQRRPARVPVRYDVGRQELRLRGHSSGASSCVTCVTLRLVCAGQYATFTAMSPVSEKIGPSF
jgi:hypothetical protein